MELSDLFTKNLKTAQKQYEAVRAVALDDGDLEAIASRFGYSVQSLRNLVNRVKNGTHQLFPDVKPGPKKRHTSDEVINEICRLRSEKNLSSNEIAMQLAANGKSVSVRTVERVLAQKGFQKLQRRTNAQRGLGKLNTMISTRTAPLDFTKLKPFRAECREPGIFMFLPYILESGILDIVSECALPESSDISKQQAALSMLALKLIGKERLSHTSDYSTDTALGIFAGLNHLPQPTYMCTYSCRTHAPVLLDFLKRIVGRLAASYPHLYQGQTINLDFHSIPHYGDESQMEKVWCGARGKTMKGANTFLAQDAQSDSVIYAAADVKRNESSAEIKNFINYWLDIKGVVNETLVFDSKLTTYPTLYELDEQGIKFITLRRRSEKLIRNALSIPETQWQRIKLPIPKRKYPHIKVYRNEVALIKGRTPFTQYIIRDHGRQKPTFIITNNDNLTTEETLTIYAKRWHIENKLAELVKFFNLNSLSSPIMTRIHFDMLWTIIADTLYHLLAKDLDRFETCTAQTIYRRFIESNGHIHFDGKTFHVKIKKKATTPVILGVEKLSKDIAVPWLNDHPVRIHWTA